MSTSPESEARKALSRLSRAAEKVERELDTLEGALKHAEGGDFPAAEYAQVRGALGRILEFANEEGQRLQDKILHAGGLEPGRVRRGGSL